MAALHKKNFLSRLRDNATNESNESEESDSQSVVSKSTDEDTDARASTESESDNLNRDKTVSPVSGESTTSDEAKDGSSSDETGDSSSEKLTIVAPLIEEESNYEIQSPPESDNSPDREACSPPHPPPPPLPPPTETPPSSSQNSLAPNIHIKSEKVDEDEPQPSHQQPAPNVGLKSSLLVHPAPSYTSNSSRSEALVRSQTSYSNQTPNQTSVLVSMPRRESGDSYRQNPSSYNSPSYSPVQLKASTTSSNSSAEGSQGGSEILRSVITGNAKPVDMRAPQTYNESPGVSPHRQTSKHSSGYSGNSGQVSNVSQYHKYGASSHSIGSGPSPTRYSSAQIVHRSPHRMNPSPSNAQTYRLVSPTSQPATKNYSGHQTINYSQNGSPIRGSPKAGPSGYNPYGTPKHEGSPQHNVQTMRTVIPCRRLSEGSSGSAQQMVTVRAAKNTSKY